MKKYIKIGLTLLLFASAFVSCDSVEDVNLPRNEKPTVNLDNSSLTVNEGSTTAVSITTSDIAPKDIIFKLVQIGGNAVEGVDYTFSEMSAADYGDIGGRVVIPAYSTSGSVDIIGLNADGTAGKTATFKLNSIQSMIGIAGDKTEVTVTIEKSNSLTMSFDWTLDIDGYSTADNIDMDIYISDATDFDIADPWLVDPLDAAATGDVPEVYSMDMADWGDGTYVIWHDLWTNDFFNEGLTDTAVPITSTFTRYGSFQQVVVQDPSQTMMSDSTEGAYSGGFTGAWHNGIIAYVTIANGVFTVTDYNGTNLVSGKASNTKQRRTERPSKFNKY